MSAVKKLFFSLLIVLAIIIGAFLYFYFQKPVVIFNKNLSAEINTDRKVFDYIESVNKGLIITKNKKIDTTKLGYQVVTIKTKNIVKRVFSYKFKVLISDTNAPVIMCNKDISTTEGISVDLLKDVKVVDNSGEEITASVEGSYDFNKAGIYNLKYIAQDSSGNRAEETFTLTVNKKVVVTQSKRSTISNSRKAEANYPYYIRVNRQLNVVYIYGIEDGEYKKLVKVFVCSAGVDTPLGVYRTSNKYEWRLLVGNSYGQYATRITGHYLFHSVPYERQSKDSLKYWLYNRLGVNDSLGCVRLTVEDAKWIYDNCPLGTKVEIYNSGSLEGITKPSAQKIDSGDSRRGWDPTDPDPANPWKNS